MKQQQKFKFKIIFGLEQTSYEFEEYTDNIVKYVERLFEFYFWLTIVNVYLVQQDKQIVINELSGLNYKCKINPLEQIILNDKNLKLKNLKSFGILKRK